MDSQKTEELKKKVEAILDPISFGAGEKTLVEEGIPFDAVRTDAGRFLPEYYLVYFLFVNLLGYKKFGRFEKTAWSIPINYKNIVYLLEHRKFGMGLFVAHKDRQEDDCKAIVKKITKAIKVAQPYFEFIANEAAQRSDLNVLNHSLELYERYYFLKDQYKNKISEAIVKKDVVIRTQLSSNSWGMSYPSYQLKQEASWLATSAIDAFFSFTEHIFIHASVLKGLLLTGEDIANLAASDWGDKFKSCLDISDPNVKKHYDRLIPIRREIRNYLAHGAFGKKGEAFQFHSEAGAVPLLMPNQKNAPRFSMERGIVFNEEEAIQAIESFMDFYWYSKLLPEVVYIQSSLPTVLPYVLDSTYSKAMNSIEDMEDFVDCLIYQQDKASNMDW